MPLNQSKNCIMQNSLKHGQYKGLVVFLTAMAMCNWLNLTNDLGKIREK